MIIQLTWAYQSIWQPHVRWRYSWNPKQIIWPSLWKSQCPWLVIGNECRGRHDLMMKIYMTGEKRVEFSSRWDAYSEEITMQGLCELGLLPVYQQQPEQQSWRDLVGYQSVSNRHLHTASRTAFWTVPILQSVPSILTDYKRYFLITVHPPREKVLLLLCFSEFHCLALGNGAPEQLMNHLCLVVGTPWSAWCCWVCEIFVFVFYFPMRKSLFNVQLLNHSFFCYRYYQRFLSELCMECHSEL